jgi:hypothetical protein
VRTWGSDPKDYCWLLPRPYTRRYPHGTAVQAVTSRGRCQRAPRESTNRRKCYWLCERRPRDGFSGQDLESKFELLLNEDALIGRNAGTQGRTRSLKSQNPRGNIPNGMVDVWGIFRVHHFEKNGQLLLCEPDTEITRAVHIG